MKRQLIWLYFWILLSFGLGKIPSHLQMFSFHKWAPCPLRSVHVEHLDSAFSWCRMTGVLCKGSIGGLPRCSQCWGCSGLAARPPGELSRLQRLPRNSGLGPERGRSWGSLYAFRAMKICQTVRGEAPTPLPTVRARSQAGVDSG